MFYLRAVANSGYIGLLMLLICASIAGYTGIKLGKCWEFILQKKPELRESPDPYPTIAKEAMGRKMEILTNASVYVTLLGACIGRVPLELISNFIIFAPFI